MEKNYDPNHIWKSVEENQYSVYSVSNHIMILIRNFHQELNSLSFCQVQNEPSWKSKQTNFQFLFFDIGHRDFQHDCKGHWYCSFYGKIGLGDPRLVYRDIFNEIYINEYFPKEYKES